MSEQDAQFYVSMKGVIINDDKVLLLRKPRGAWDLPGGRLGIGENPKQCLTREVREETGLIVKPQSILFRWVRHRAGRVDVFLVSHLCPMRGSTPIVILSPEHEEFGWFSPEDSETLATSKGIKKSIRNAFHLNSFVR